MRLSTNQVASKLGLTAVSLGRYIKAGKVPAPPEAMFGGARMRLWTERDIKRLKEFLPKIANGRKTRYQKLREKKNQAQAGVPVPHKKRKTKKTKKHIPRPKRAPE